MSHQTPAPAARTALHKKFASRLKSCLTPTRKGAETTTPTPSRPSSRSSTTTASNLPIANTYTHSSSSTTTLVPSNPPSPRPSTSTSTLSPPKPHPLHLQIPTRSHILPPTTPTPTSPFPISPTTSLAHPFLTTLLSTTHPTAHQNGQITPLYAPSALRLSTLVALARTQDRASGIRLCGKLFRAVVIHEEVAGVVWEALEGLAGGGGGDGEDGEGAVGRFMVEMRGAGRCCVWCPVGGEGRGTCRGVVGVREEEWQEGVVWQREERAGKKWGDAPPVVG